VTRVTAEHLDQVLHPQFASSDLAVIATGLAASPGAAVGSAYFTADDATAAVERGERVILVRNETSPEDVHGMIVSEGILTARGGLVSHAAWSPGVGKPAVCGAEAVRIKDRSFSAGGVTVNEGDVISIDGTTGKLSSVQSSSWMRNRRRSLTLFSSGPTTSAKASWPCGPTPTTDPMPPTPAVSAAEGSGCAGPSTCFWPRIGCRSLRRMILAETATEEAAALEELRVAQKADFIEILEAMDGLPVTVRLAGSAAA